MSYQVLARKYRPETFQDVVGQEHVTQTLLNAFAIDRIAHAYLFAGPRGVGKTTTARILAKALNCLKNDKGNPCNSCQNCVEISTSRSMDVLEIDGASNRGIDEIRNLRDQVKYTPINSKFRVFIIDEVHMLTTQAFNALLKTLEEPPPHVKFIFATTEPNKVLPTIISRCQRYDFHRMSEEDISTGMEVVLKEEKINIDDPTKKFIIGLADGSMRDALSILDQIIAFCGENIEFGKASTLLGIIPEELYFGITDAIKSKNRIELIRTLQDVYSRGFSLPEFVSGLNKHMINILTCSLESGEELLEVSTEMTERYKEESQKWDPKDILRYSDILTELEMKLKIVQQPRLYTETTFLKLLEMDSTISITDLIKKLSGQMQEKIDIQPALFSNLEDKDSNVYVSVPSVKEAKPSQRTEYKQKTEKPSRISDVAKESLFSKIENNWNEIVSKVSENGTSLSTFLSHGKPKAIDGKRLTISLPRKYKFQIDFLKKKASLIESTFEKELKEKVKIDFVVQHDKEEEIIKNMIETNPVTQRMLELFGGKEIT